MGLCKCPAKKVTQQFCFEHRVNVCEQCMLNSHPKCIVKPYFQWLEDSNYNPICSLCQKNLSSEDCIRLLCFHIFHWKCLNNFANGLPANTAPSGYTCPDCNKPIIPSADLSTPLSKHLKSLLSSVSWSRPGLGLPFIENKFEYNEVLSQSNSLINNQKQSIHIVHDSGSKSSSIPLDVSHINDYFNCDESNIANSRKFHEMTNHHLTISSPILDIDEDKYRRKSPKEFVSRFVRSYTIGNQRKVSPYRKWVIIIILIMIAVFTVLHYFIKFGRESADLDPLLDPHFNPNIRVAYQDDN